MTLIQLREHARMKAEQVPNPSGEYAYWRGVAAACAHLSEQIPRLYTIEWMEKVAKLCK